MAEFAAIILVGYIPSFGAWFRKKYDMLDGEV
jgi:hypothetical protein